jgi:hypothetical protein
VRWFSRAVRRRWSSLGRLIDTLYSEPRAIIYAHHEAANRTGLDPNSIANRCGKSAILGRLPNLIII